MTEQTAQPNSQPETLQDDGLSRQEGHSAHARIKEHTGHERPLPITYTAEEVAKTFEEMLQFLDFSREYQELGISRLSLIKRSVVVRQFTALAIALWKLALERSFPNDAGPFFVYFLDHSPLVTGKSKKATYIREQALAYCKLLEPKGYTDFSVAAQHLAGVLQSPEQDTKSFSLKLALRIRTLYSNIFDHLI